MSAAAPYSALRQDRQGKLRVLASARRTDDQSSLSQVHETRQGRNGEVLVQPIRIRPLYTADRTNKLWGETEITALLAVASAEIKLALVLALWTGQRQGDLLRLPWSSYDGTHVRFRQSKTGRRVTMPVEAVDQFIDDRRDPYNEMADRIGDAIKQET